MNFDDPVYKIIIKTSKWDSGLLAVVAACLRAHTHRQTPAVLPGLSNPFSPIKQEAV